MTYQMKRPSRHLILPGIVAGFMAISHEVQAEIGIKKLIIQDCAKAKESLTALSDSEKPDFVRFLSLLLKQAPLPPEKAPVGPSNPTQNKGGNPFESPLDENASGELFHILDPSHDTDAKLCALDALTALTPQSFQAIPALLDVASTVSIDSAVRNRIASIMIEIVGASSRLPGYSPEAGVIKSAVEGLETTHRKLSENLLIELGAASLPALLEEFKRPDPARRNRVERLLLLLDPEGSSVSQAILPLLTSGDADIRSRVLIMLGKLPLIALSTLPSVIGALNDLSFDVQNAAMKALTNLAPTYAHSEQFLKQAFEAGLLKFKERGDKGRELPQNLVTALLPKYTAGSKSLSALLTSNEDDLIVRVLDILADQGEPLGEETASALITILPKSSERVALKTISILARTKTPKKVSEAITNFILNKRKGNALGSQPIIKASLGTLSQLPSLDSLSIKLIPEAIALIPHNRDIESSFANSNSSAVFLKKTSKESLQSLVKAAKDLKGEQSVGALLILSSMTPVPPAVVDTALSLLKTDDLLIRKTAEAVLQNHGKGSMKQLEALLKNKVPAVKFSAAKILGMMGSKNPLILPILLEQIPIKGCSDISDIITPVAALQNGISATLFSRVIQCVQSHAISLDTFGNIAEKISPLADDSKRDLLELLRTPETDKFLRLKLIELAKTLKLPPTEATAILVNFASSGDSALALVSFEAIRALGSQAALAAPQLIALAKKNDIEPVIRNEAALVASEVAPDKDEYIEFFISELKGDLADWALKTISRLQPGQMKAVLDKAYDAISGENRRFVIRLIAQLPREQAMTFTDRLLTILSSMKVPETRLEALIALLKINPTLPQIAGPLREALIDANREELIAHKFGEDIKPVLQSMLPNAQSRLERLGIGAMLARQGSNT